MKKTSLFPALIALSLLGASVSTAAHAQKAGDRGGNGGGSTGGSGPSGNVNSNFDNGSVWALAAPQDCQRNPRYCKQPVKIVPVVDEVPASKCQQERMIQVANDTYGEPIFRRYRECDRRYIR